MVVVLFLVVFVVVLSLLLRLRLMLLPHTVTYSGGAGGYGGVWWCMVVCGGV